MSGSQLIWGKFVNGSLFLLLFCLVAPEPRPLRQVQPGRFNVDSIEPRAPRPVRRKLVHVHVFHLQRPPSPRGGPPAGSRKRCAHYFRNCRPSLWRRHFKGAGRCRSAASGTHLWSWQNLCASTAILQSVPHLSGDLSFLFMDRAAGTLQSQFLPGVSGWPLQEQIFFPAGGPFIPAASGLPPSPSSALYRRRAKCDRRAFLPTKWGFPLLASFCAIPWWKLG